MIIKRKKRILNKNLIVLNNKILNNKNETKDYARANLPVYILAIEKLQKKDNDNYKIIFEDMGYILLKKVYSDKESYEFFPKKEEEIRSL